VGSEKTEESDADTGQLEKSKLLPNQNNPADVLQPPLISVLSHTVADGGEKRMKQGKFPPGWDAERVKRGLVHYESQSEEEAVAEDEAAFEDLGQTVMEVPIEIVPAIRALIAKHKAA
jgi:hypothetical protein